MMIVLKLIQSLFFLSLTQAPLSIAEFRASLAQQECDARICAALSECAHKCSEAYRVYISKVSETAPILKNMSDLIVRKPEWVVPVNEARPTSPTSTSPKIVTRPNSASSVATIAQDQPRSTSPIDQPRITPSTVI